MTSQEAQARIKAGGLLSFLAYVAALVFFILAVWPEVVFNLSSYREALVGLAFIAGAKVLERFGA